MLLFADQARRWGCPLLLVPPNLHRWSGVKVGFLFLLFSDLVAQPEGAGI